MSFPEILSLFAELSIGLAGFGGVASAFSGRERTFSQMESVRLRSLLLSAASVFVGCLGFYCASIVGIEEVRSTSVAAICSLPLTSFFAATIVPPSWRSAYDPNTTTEKAHVVVFTIMTLAMIVAYLGTVVSGGSQAMLLVGFSVQLTFGLWMFERLLTRVN